jgi:hypothetical protein
MACQPGDLLKASAGAADGRALCSLADALDSRVTRVECETAQREQNSDDSRIATTWVAHSQLGLAAVLGRTFLKVNQSADTKK